MKKLLLFLVTTICSLTVTYAQLKPADINNKALNSRSDTIDILHYQINLDITDFTNKIITGNCKITFTPKLNGTTKINFDLLELNVDSVKDAANNLLSFSYNDTLLELSFSTLLNVGDTSEVTIFYNGTPQTDNSGFGGFYFDNTYAYNLGVGFNADPHNYGRVWFPCFDNFVEHATFEFNIITSGGKKAHCNGVLIADSVIAGDTIVRKWIMNEPIPTYLACVAVSDYTTVHQTFLGTNGIIPVELAARAPDTTNFKNSFVNLNQALAIYENQYGPYLWSKIGFILVPFNSGAMEHATCVAYPRVAANGSLAYETLMAHEFAHHWWGNLVTCETAGDMWINEGFATYSEHIFTEFMYGRGAYMSAVKANNKQVLQYAHIDDDGFRALSNMDHAYTYGTHSYLKGALVAHNMRAYLGDSLFFYGVQQLMDSFKFKNINPTQFEDFLTTSTSVDMTDFFNDWVLSPGFSNFKVDSFEVALNSPNFDVTLYVQQKLRGATNFHIGTPIEATFYDNNWNKFTTEIVASGQYSTAMVSVPFQPTVVILNEANLLNQARTDNQLKIKNTFSSQIQNLTLLRIGVSAVSDSALLHIEHHWVAPDSVKNNVNNYKISSSRYWRFTGILPSGFSASVRIDFDGRANSGFLDTDLLSVSHDSLVLLYREDAHDDWQEFPYYAKTVLPGIPYGYVVIDSLMLGEYTFANSASAVEVSEIKEKKAAVIELFPNPTDNVFWLKTLAPYKQLQVVVYDMLGNVAHEEIFNNQLQIDVSGWDSGNYIVTVFNDNQLIHTGKLVIQ